MGMVWPPPRSQMGVAQPPTFFFSFFNFFFKMGPLEFNACIWGNFKNFVPKDVRVAHISHFSSKKTEMANRLVTLKILKTLLCTLPIFKDWRQK
jgi:hypothetical protein